MLRVVSWAGVVQIRPQAMQGESLLPAELLLVTLSMVWQHRGHGNMEHEETIGLSSQLSLMYRMRHVINAAA